VRRAGRPGEELSEHGHAARSDRRRTEKAALERFDRRAARGVARRASRILGDRHLGSNRGRGAVNDPLRTHGHAYRKCEDLRADAHAGARSTAASREVLSVTGPAMRPTDFTRRSGLPDTTLADGQTFGNADLRSARG
jgi:hypothetical protein